MTDVHPCAWAVTWSGPIPVGHYWPGDWQAEAERRGGAVTDVPPVTDAEIEIISDFIARFRVHPAGSKTQPISAATVALGLPALGQVQRIDLVLAEMHDRGLLKHVYDIEGSPSYMEVRDGEGPGDEG
jgi:hypothetical protein